jgi:hypothetical protein
MALSERVVVGRENKKYSKGKYLVIQNTFVRKALAASMNSFRDWPCKHKRVFYEKIKSNIFVFNEEIFSTELAFKANFQIFEFFFPRRVIERKFSRFKAITLAVIPTT